MDAQALLDWIATHDRWVYGLLFAYGLAKTGPLPMVAGFVSVSGALQPAAVALVVLLGTLLGSQLRYGVGHGFSPWLFERFPGFAPWLALGAVGVERFSLALLPLYRFSKGTYTLVGLGAGMAIPWRRFVWLDGTGALLWVLVSVGLGYALGLAGAQVDPRWAAYVGLSLLALDIVATAVFGKRLKRLLLPQAQAALAQAQARRAAGLARFSRS
jgi:membrane protein DedA with SNARE-associated domain